MKSTSPPPPESSRLGLRLLALVLLAGLLAALIAIVRPSPTPPPGTQTDPAATSMTVTHSGRGLGMASPAREFKATPARPAEEVVAEKLSLFTSNRAALVTAMAKHLSLEVPPEVTQFFAAAQADDWPATTNQFKSLQALRQSPACPPGLASLWPAIVETYGVAEQTHLWPAAQLLDYGNTILDSLRPGMIYVGGNDAGRFIPTLLSETSGAAAHIVLTQNALADGSYLEYLRFQYRDQLNLLTTEDSQTSFQNYLADAQQRLQHDRDFPNEPKQVRPGEDIRIEDNRVQVSGQVAVMSINELLLTTLLQKNPDLSFALEESFPLKSLYNNATTLGPITELRASDTANALTAERAAQTIDYWRDTTSSVLTTTDAASAPREAYTKMILGQANLFADRQFTSAAEQAYQLATELSPANPEAVFSYVKLLADQKRFGAARQVLQTALNTTPNNEIFRQVLTSLNREQ